jgi:hypothetical protein
MSDNLWLFAAASLLLLVGHFLRAVRWASLFSGTTLKRRFDLLLGLAVGYLINSIIPFRVGELARIWFVSRNGSITYATVASTVVAERFSDLVVVGLGALALFGLTDFAGELDPAGVWVLLGTAAAVFGAAVLVKRSQRARRLVWMVASIFNERIQLRVLDFFWSTSELILGGGLLNPKFILGTVAMWVAYGASYLAFARSVGQPVYQLTYALLGLPFKSALTYLGSGQNLAGVSLMAFTTAPVLGVLVYGGFKQYPRFMKVLTRGGRYAWNGTLQDSLVVKGKFRTDDEYGYFLTALFSGTNSVATTFGLQAIDDGAVAKLFTGGSDAITALVDVKGHLAIRKFAVGSAGDKLKNQHDWLLKHRSAQLPLVSVLREQPKEGCYYYDMPLVVPANDFYDFIHTAPIAESQRILSAVCESISGFHAAHEQSQASPDTVDAYLRDKVVGNATKVLEFIRPVIGADRFTINGQTYDLRDWEKLLDMTWLNAQISRREMTVVHGDLTIENVIVAPGKAPDWYIIDPNPDNIFNTRLIDWAKLMQSVNLGYEGLNRNFACSLKEQEIRLAFTKSQAYTQLHELLVSEILKRFGPDVLREVYFHELVNYLRLTPYKIRQDPKKGLCFFACTSVLLKHYNELKTT